MINKLKSFKKGKFTEVPKLFSVLLDQFFMSITTLLTSIVLARTYDKIDYADLILLFSISLFILGFQSSIISKPYAINLNDFRNGKREGYYRFNLHFKILFTVFVIIVFPLLYYIIFDSWNVEKLFFFSLYIIAYTSYFFIRETLLSERKTKLNLVYGLGCSLSLITLLLFILFTNHGDINFFLGISSAIYIIATLVYLFKNLKKPILTKKDYIGHLYTNWKVGKWLLGSNFFFHLSTSIYPWLLLYITTKSDIAVFGVLISVSSIINPVMTALSSYLLPLFVKMNLDYQKIDVMVKNWTFLFGVMALFLIVIGYFFGQTIIVLLFGKAYGDLGILVVYPFIIQAIHVLFQPFKICLNAIKRTDVNFWVLIPRSIISLILGYILIQKYGVVGAFYTMIIESLFYQVMHFIIYRNIMKLNKSLVNS
ncbi:MAG: polysaccharide biosynthesis protein [Saonia sp.]